MEMYFLSRSIPIAIVFFINYFLPRKIKKLAVNKKIPISLAVVLIEIIVASCSFSILFSVEIVLEHLLKGKDFILISILFFWLCKIIGNYPIIELETD